MEKFIPFYTFTTQKEPMNLSSSKKPYPVKLGEKKTFLQQEACSLDRSLHWLINKILEEWVLNKQKEAVEKN